MAITFGPKKIRAIEPDSAPELANSVIALLASVRSNIQSLSGDDACVFLLDECSSRLRARYRLPPEAKSLPGGASFAAIVRLLVYVRQELADGLGDVQCAALVQGCVDHLIWASSHERAAPNGQTTYVAM